MKQVKQTRLRMNTGHWGGGPTHFQRLMGSNTTTQQNHKAKGQVPSMPKLNLPELIPEDEYEQAEYERRRRRAST